MSAHDVTNKILLRDSEYIVDEVMWPNFGNSSISMKEVIMACTPLQLGGKGKG